MASTPDHARSGTPDHDGAFANPSFPAGPPSIISSRMTDIASDDGNDGPNQFQKPASLVNRSPRRSLLADSRPGTARTGASSAWGQSQPGAAFRRTGVAGHRGSVTGGAPGAGSTRPQSSTSRSHVPSLTSHAFFHPMSSQRLQAQRASRPPTMGQDGKDGGAASAGIGVSRSATQRSTTSRNTRPSAAQGVPGDVTPERPPSRGTEMTEPDPLDRVTANTSPTQGHNAAGSMTDSTRPLAQRLTAETDESDDDTVRQHRGAMGGGGGGGERRPSPLKNLGINSKGAPPPLHSGRSFRSSFLLGGMGGGDGSGTNRDNAGAEKLSSAASSPKLGAVDGPASGGARGEAAGGAGRRKSGAKHEGGGGGGHKGDGDARKAGAATKRPSSGRNWEYFEGNLVFCLSGRLQNTREHPFNLVTAVLFVTPSALFFAFSAPWLWYNISPAIPIVFGYVFLICASSFIHASVSDPGVRIFFSVPPFLLATPPCLSNVSRYYAERLMPNRYCRATSTGSLSPSMTTRSDWARRSRTGR